MPTMNVTLIQGHIVLPSYMADEIDRRDRPWMFPDPSRWPRFVLFPRWARLTARVMVRFR